MERHGSKRDWPSSGVLSHSLRLMLQQGSLLRAPRGSRNAVRIHYLLQPTSSRELGRPANGADSHCSCMSPNSSNATRSLPPSMSAAT